MKGFNELIQLHRASSREREAAERQEALRSELAVLDERLSGAKEALAAAEGRRDEIAAARRKVEGDVELIETQRSKYREQLMSAKTNEVYRTLLSEIETAGERISERETEILELMEKADEAEGAVEQASQELAAAEKALRSEAGRMNDEITSLEAVREEAARDVAVLREKVPAALLSSFDRIAAMRSGRALALAVDHHCAECHESVRPQVWVEVFRGTVHHCSGCSRILYREEIAEPGPAPAEAGG